MLPPTHIHPETSYRSSQLISFIWWHCWHAIRLHHFNCYSVIQSVAIKINITHHQIQELEESDSEHAGIMTVPDNRTIDAILQELAAKDDFKGDYSAWWGKWGGGVIGAL